MQSKDADLQEEHPLPRRALCAICEKEGVPREEASCNSTLRDQKNSEHFRCAEFEEMLLSSVLHTAFFLFVAFISLGIINGIVGGFVHAFFLIIGIPNIAVISLAIIGLDSCVVWHIRRKRVLCNIDSKKPLLIEREINVAILLAASMHIFIAIALSWGLFL